MARLRFTDDARADLIAIARYIAQASGSAIVAKAFRGQLLDKCERLAALPGTMGRERPELRADIRSTAFKGYVIFFRYDGGDVLEVVNVMERHRDVEERFAEGE